MFFVSRKAKGGFLHGLQDVTRVMAEQIYPALVKAIGHNDSWATP